VFVWNKQRIQSHFLICYVALVLLRLIQHSIGFKYPIAAISGIKGTKMKENYYLFGYCSELTDALSKLINADLARQVYSRKELKNILAAT
jgi:transposase